MEGKTISKIFSKDPYVKRWFKGFLTPDLSIPELKFKTPTLFVLNTDDHDGPGEHWCILIIHDRRRAEFFDSFGRSPTVYSFTKEILKHAKNIIFNEYPVQCLTAATCGHHCIFWAVYRARGFEPREIMKFYSAKGCSRNDKMVFKFVKKYFGSRAAKIVL